MIDTISLQNFQAHKETVLKLHPGVNVIVGSTDSGKSSILRAINWLVYNRPSGGSFVSHWALDVKKNQKDDTVVSLQMGDTTIQRTRSKTTKNTYTVNEKVLEAIGLDVPDEVSVAMNLSDVNIQKQHDRPFLLDSSPGEVARFFNKIVHFDAIDHYLSTLEGMKRAAKSKHVAFVEQAEKMEKRMLEYDWLEQAEILIGKLKVLEEDRERQTDQIQEFSTSIVDYEKAAAIHAPLQGILTQAVDHVRKIDILLEAQRNVADQYQDLSPSIVSYEKAQEYLKTVGNDIPYAERIIKKIDSRTILDIKLKQYINALREQLESYTLADRVIRDGTVLIAEQEALLPDACPLCGKEL